MKRFRSRFSITGAAVLPVMLSFLFASCTADDPASSLPDDYAGWQRTTDLVLNNPIPGHGTGLRVIFINEVGATSAQLPDGSYRYPDGTIVIKEVYATPNPEAGDAPAMLTAMVKQEESEDALGGWIWITKDPGTGTESIVREEFCITCHANANEGHPYGDRNSSGTFRDYLFFPFPVSPESR